MGCVCVWTLVKFHIGGGGGGGGAAAGSEPLAYFRESRTPKIYPILGKSHNPGHSKWSGLQKHFRETFIIPGSRKGSGLGKAHPILRKFDEITPYFMETGLSKSKPVERLPPPLGNWIGGIRLQSPLTQYA